MKLRLGEEGTSASSYWRGRETSSHPAEGGIKLTPPPRVSLPIKHVALHVAGG